MNKQAEMPDTDIIDFAHAFSEMGKVLETDVALGTMSQLNK